MDLSLYEQFLKFKERGQREKAREPLLEFITSFQSFEEKKSWVHTFLEAEEFGHTIRHEIYQHLVFPVLLDGYTKKDAWATLWLAKTAQNLYANKLLHSQVGYKSEFQLLKEAYSLEPSEPVRNYLLEAELQWFRHCQHEWPAGILYGMDGATTDQCEDILQEVAFVKTLDPNRKHANFVNDFENKVHEYQNRLTSK